jgi:Fe-S-cluster containining protein
MRWNVTTVGCAGCGDCCRRIHVNTVGGGLTARLADPYVAGRARRDAQFIQDHMHSTGEVDASHPGRVVRTCDAFDGHRCTAYGQRPEMCSLYPWYESGPRAEPEVAQKWRAGKTDDELAAWAVQWMGDRCSYLRDLPTPTGGWLAVGARPLIPLTPL